MKTFIKQLFCTHEYQFIVRCNREPDKQNTPQKVYANYDWLICKKCGKSKYKFNGSYIVTEEE